jgi:hypothetical protein
MSLTSPNANSSSSIEPVAQLPINNNNNNNTNNNNSNLESNRMEVNDISSPSYNINNKSNVFQFKNNNNNSSSSQINNDDNAATSSLNGSVHTPTTPSHSSSQSTGIHIF